MKRIGFTKNLASANRIDSWTEFWEFTSFFVSEFCVGSLPWNDLEQSSESFLLFLFHVTEFQTFFSSAKWFWTEFQEFSVPRNSRNSAGTNQLSVNSVFRGIIFWSEIANPMWGWWWRQSLLFKHLSVGLYNMSHNLKFTHLFFTYCITNGGQSLNFIIRPPLKMFRNFQWQRSESKWVYRITNELSI